MDSGIRGCPKLHQPYPRKWVGLENLVRCIHVDSMANATFLKEEMKLRMPNPRNCSARIQVANKQFMKASSEGNDSAMLCVKYDSR